MSQKLKVEGQKVGATGLKQEEISIKVTNVSKSFKLPHEKNSSIKSLVLNPFKKRTYEKQEVLKDINFEIKKGEFFGIVGRNGSGKSTLLKLLAGIYSPDKGHIQVSGKLTPFIELGVGFNPELTGRENVFLNGALLGFNRKKMSAMYDDIVEFAELEKFMDQKLKNYSSGMQVRLAFSIAICAESDILLLDEVLAVGDADFQRKCYNYFSSLKKTKHTVVFISHDMAAVRQYCDKVLFLNEGVIKLIGTADESAQAYSKLFNTSDNINENVIDDKNEDGRWGNGTAEIYSLAVEVDKKEITITEKIKIKSTLSKINCGIKIKSASNTEVLGTNSNLEKITIPDVRKGDEVVLEWIIPNILSDGIFTIDPAIIHEDGVTVIDWWDNAKRFKIIKPKLVPYSVDPGFSVNVQVNKSNAKNIK